MHSRSVILVLMASMLLAACQVRPQGSARAVPLAVSAIGREEAHNWQLSNLEVTVPSSLQVSEENSFKPNADIVWREDPCCDRHSQVDALMTAALSSALEPLDGEQPVSVQFQVTRFHALTERTRYTFGGEHEIEFLLTVVDASTGEVLRGPRAVDLTFPGAGGEQALAEEARGYYQRDAITERLIAWAQIEFGLAQLEDVVVAN